MTIDDQNGNTGGPQFDEAMAERYLFGELNEAEQEEFEIAYFADDAYFERFLAVKNELLDLYARDELDQDKHNRMDAHFLATGPRRERVKESRGFIIAITTVSNRATAIPFVVVHETSSSTGGAGWFHSIARYLAPLRLAGAVVFLFAAIGGVWLLVLSTKDVDRAGQQPPANYDESNSKRGVAITPTDTNVNRGQQNESNRRDPNVLPSQELAVDSSRQNSTRGVGTVSPSETPDPNTLAKSDPTDVDPKINVPTLAPTPEVFAGNRTDSITLDGSTRSVTKGNTASIGTATQSIAIRMQFSGESYPSYSVHVVTIGGTAVWQARNLRGPLGGGAKSLTVTIPASLLARKDYIVTLNGHTADGKTETIREYYFHVDRSGAN